MYAVCDESVIKRSSEEDLAWAPIVDLLRTTPQLRDLIYDCQSQFPPSLLTLLHERYPQCRLHHLSFKFRTLLWSILYPYEIELATSPNLHRVKIMCADRDSDSDDDFNLEAAMQLAAGLAPNLKEITVLNLLPGGSLRSQLPRRSWSGLPRFVDGKLGSLTSLSLKGFSQLHHPGMLEAWARHTDFTYLQQLTLGGCFDARTSGLSGETMDYITRTYSFPRVTVLDVYLTRHDLDYERPHYSEHAASFIQAFQSLEELTINGPLDLHILDTVLLHHGQTLRKLSLHPFEDSYSNSRERKEIPFEFTRDRIVQISNQCPALEELSIPVKRDRSRASEAEIYKALGQFANLRSLFLISDCSNWRVTRDHTYQPAFNEIDQKPLTEPACRFVQRGELKNTFINCAVDEELARSIWKIISQSKAGRPLEHLKLWPTGAGEYGTNRGLPHSFILMARNMTRSWLLDRSPREDSEDFTVRELGLDRREIRDQEDFGYLSYGHDPDVWEVFHSIRPSKGTGDWQDDWSSFPLQVD